MYNIVWVESMAKNHLDSVTTYILGGRKVGLFPYIISLGNVFFTRVVKVMS